MDREMEAVPKSGIVERLRNAADHAYDAIDAERLEQAASTITALKERVRVLEGDIKALLNFADVQRMPFHLLPAALEIAEERFSARGDHGGSPGEAAWERMNEIETRIKRGQPS